MQEIITQIYGYLYSMWRFRWSALLISWVVALAGWLVVFSLPNQYEANAVVHIDTESIMKPLLEGLAVETDAGDDLQIISRVLLSRETLDSVIRETDLDLQVRDAKTRGNLIESLASTIEIKGGGDRRNKNNIYEISYTSTSAERVYQVVSELVNELIENTLSSSRTDTVMAQEFLDKQIKEFEQRLTVAEEDLAEFKRKNVGFMPDEKGGYYQRLQAESQELDNTRSSLKLAQRRFKELNKQLKGESPLIDNSSFGAGSAIKLRKYREELESLLSQYTEQHPDVLALRAKIADLRDGNIGDDTDVVPTGSSDSVEFNPVYQELKVELNKAGVEIETLKIELEEQMASVEKLKESIDFIPAVEAQLAKLNRGYEVTRSRYLDLVERRESAHLAQMAGQSGSDVSFRIIEPPIVPAQPTGPNRFLYLVGVLFVALATGVGWSLLRYLLRPTYQSMQQLRSDIGLPILGAVSLYLTPEHIKNRRIQLVTFVLAAIMLFGLFGGVLIYKDKGTAVAEAIIAWSSVRL